MIRPRRNRLTNRQREALWDSCCGDRERPACNICGLDVWPGQAWDVSHSRYQPHALGGTDLFVAHRRCNRLWGWRHDAPLVAKVKRMRQKFIGAYRPRHIMPGSREDRLKKKLNGDVVRR